MIKTRTSPNNKSLFWLAQESQDKLLNVIMGQDHDRPLVDLVGVIYAVNSHISNRQAYYNDR